VSDHLFEVAKKAKNTWEWAIVGSAKTHQPNYKDGGRQPARLYLGRNRVIEVEKAQH
jgi:hypothetical protein